MPRILSVSNQKGGVGKTTTAVNLATALAHEDMMVLLIDLDPQGNASSGLGVPKNEVSAGVADVLLGFRELPDVVVPTCVDGLHLVPATRELVGLEIELVDASKREAQKAWRIHQPKACGQRALPGLGRNRTVCQRLGDCAHALHNDW